MNRFDQLKTTITDVKVIISKPIIDERGELNRIFCKKELKKIFSKNIVQINHTLTKEVGSIRGLHYQKTPYREVKMIKCIKGKVFDVALDIRKNSPTFLNYHSEILSSKNNKIIIIPEGFAHGFQTLTKNSELIYFHTQFYNQKYENGINLNDKKINIKWPKKITFISNRDKKFKLLTNNFEGI